MFIDYILNHHSQKEICYGSEYVKSPCSFGALEKWTGYLGIIGILV